MFAVLASPQVQDALIVAAIVVVGAVILALGAAAALRRLAELSGHAPGKRRR